MSFETKLKQAKRGKVTIDVIDMKKNNLSQSIKAHGNTHSSLYSCEPIEEDKDKKKDEKEYSLTEEQKAENRKLIFDGIRSNIRNSRLTQRLLSAARV